MSKVQSLVIAIYDAQHTNDYADRFNQAITISPGVNHIDIPLDDIRQAPVGQELDLSAIRAIRLFAISPREEFSKVSIISDWNRVASGNGEGPERANMGIIPIIGGSIYEISGGIRHNNPVWPLRV